MKSYASEELINYKRAAIPMGAKLPRAPLMGEMFYLTADMPAANNMLPWYPRGAYCFNGMEWEKLNDVPRARKSGMIGSQKVENDKPAVAGDLPTATTGIELTSVSVRPTNSKSVFSGTASIWLDASEPCSVWLAAFRANKFITVALNSVQPGKLSTLSLSFCDSPGGYGDQVYSIRCYSDAKTFYYINRGSKITFDGRAHTLLIVEENT